jgi:hypothetical protein
MNVDNDIIKERKKEMAYKTKEQYQRHADNAHRRNQENKEITTLSEEQHDALAALCAFRHELHTNQKSLFNTESCNHSDYIRSLDGEIMENLNEVGLPNSLTFDIFSFESDSEYDEDIDGDYDEWYEKSIAGVFSFVEKVNSEIENYLREIDKIHGTSYCPTGALRNF